MQLFDSETRLRIMLANEFAQELSKTCNHIRNHIQKNYKNATACQKSDIYYTYKSNFLAKCDFWDENIATFSDLLSSGLMQKVASYFL